MGRFTSVQAFSDTNSAVRQIPYEQTTVAASASSASTTTAGKVVSVKPEKVVNPYGSAAGAGSGEFHLYRQGRAREMQRLELLTEQQQRAMAEREFQEQLLRNKREVEERTERRRKKRQRLKDAKERKKNLQRAVVNIATSSEQHYSSDASGDGNGAEEFVYIPSSDNREETPAVDAFPNDGSFLERMKHHLAGKAAGSHGTLSLVVEANDSVREPLKSTNDVEDTT